MGLTASKLYLHFTSYRATTPNNEDCTTHCNEEEDEPPKHNRVIRVTSVSCTYEFSQESKTEVKNPAFKRTFSEVSLTCSNETEESSDNEGSGNEFHDIRKDNQKENGHNKDDAPQTKKKLARTVSKLEFTSFEEVSYESKEKISVSRRFSQVAVSCYTEVERDNEKDSDCDDNSVKYEQTSRKTTRSTTFIGMSTGTIEVQKESKDTAQYCVQLLNAQFVGQTTFSIHTDISEHIPSEAHLGDYLRLMDDYLRSSFQNCHDFTGTESSYLKVLRHIAKKRKHINETEEECYERLKDESKRFAQIYRKRGVPSEEIIDHQDFWGTRQQLLSGKVIADWIEKENGPLDPIFGILLNPTSGRTGPGDAGIVHTTLFDDNGPFAYHSAVHDAFGYLITYHKVGPGYDYLHNTSSSNPLAGQYSGLGFWKRVLQTEELKPHICSLVTKTLGILPILAHQAKKDVVFF